MSLEPVYDRANVKIYQGDVFAVLPELPTGSVHCVVTSPPYWGLRDYGTAEWKGGDPACDHIEKELRRGVNLAKSAASTRGGAKKCAEVGGLPYLKECGKCGATRSDRQLGLEPTPEEYIERMVSVFREVRRVLRDDGTLWLNMGDSYCNGTSTVRPSSKNSAVGGWSGEANQIARNGTPPGYKPKDLMGIPWMLAFALRSDGWYLRSDIIWSKPNPMPESVTDRPTKAHEYIFLMSKSERYYYDAEAILEPVSENTHLRISQNLAQQIGSARANGDTRSERPMKAVVRSATAPRVHGNLPGRSDGGKFCGPRRKRGEIGSGIKNNDSFTEAVCLPVNARNKRSVWTVTVQGFREAHFATFPEDLIRPCIVAGCPRGGTVLDPFLGAGTTALVAQMNHCSAIGVELNPDYIEMAKGRLRQDVLPF